MRILVLACLVALATSSCDWHGSSSSVSDFALPEAVARSSMRTREAADQDSCGFTIEEAASSTQSALLAGLSGVWRDSLGDAVKSESSSTLSQEGLRFDRQGSSISLEIGRTVVRITPSDFSNDDLETERFESILSSTRVRVGQSSNDGFTALQAHFQLTKSQPERCVMIAVRVLQMGDGRRVLLVRGPLADKPQGSAKPASAFFYQVHDTTRMFTH